MLVLCQSDGDLRSVWSVISAVSVFDILRWFDFKVDCGPIHEYHIKSYIMFCFEDMEDVIEDQVFVFSECCQTAVACIVSEIRELEVFQKQGIIRHPFVASADREVFCHFVGDKTGDQSAERMTAVFKAVQDWC